MSITGESLTTRRPVSRSLLLAAACLAAFSSAAEPKLKNTIVVPLRLPRNYEPAALPAHPIDEGLRVGVVLPPFDRGFNATWTTPVSWVGNPNLRPVPKENITEIDRVFINAAEPVAGALPKIFHRLFPRSEILQNRYCPGCDVVFIVRAESGNIINNQNNLAGLTVTVSITAIAPNGVTVASLSGTGSGMRTKSTYWSTQTEARGMGEPALQAAMEQLFTRLASDATMSAFAKEKSAERARPSELETSVTFDDADSFLPNGRLDAGEHAHLRFSIRNQGAGPAFAVHLRVTANTVGVPAETEVGDIPPGGSKEIDVPLAAGIEIETAQQQLHVETLEKRGYGGRPVVVQLATERLTRPTLEIADVRLDDRGARAHGDGNGRPSNGETLEAVILVRNSGPGQAVGATLTISSIPGLELVEPVMKVGAIPINAVKEVRTLIRIPITFNGPDLGLTFRAVETRGAAVAAAEREQRWALELKRPQIEIGFRLFDGNSTQSRGNRDGVANNGETIEVALVPSNRGTLAARAVRLTLTSSVAGLEMKPASIEIGELPPLAEGTEHRVQLTIPRALGNDGLRQRLPMSVTVTQADFPAGEQLIDLPFSVQRPELLAAVTSQTTLVEGKAALFALDIRNQGSLAAEDVKAVVSSDNPAVELLDASGTPARIVHIDLGSIPAETAAGRIPLKAHIRQNISAAGGLLKVSVSQRDFAAVGAQTALNILKQEPVVISAVPPVERERPVALRAAGIPATVSFQRYRDGSKLGDETVGLAFEVQSQTPLEMVRLEQNHRVIDLPQGAPIGSGGTYLWQYEPQVHLDYGANEFQVVAVTSEGVRNSRSITLHREKPQGKIWLAVVGVSNYREPAINDLDFAKDDAVAVHDYYRQHGVPNEQVLELLDENATLANIKRSLGTELVKRANNPDDTVLIYFAGHGEMESDRSSSDSDGYSKYLLPYDANPADLFGSALSMEELSRILQRLRPERVVLVIDSCFSGAAGGRTPFEPNAASRGVISEDFLSRIANIGKGRVILTASGSHEVAQESSATHHGIFTYFFLEGLRGAADTDHDGRVDVDEIYKYVSQKVSTATHGRQNPTRKSPNLTGTLVLGGRLQ